MSDIAIRVEGLSKLYRIGARQKRHQTLRDAFSKALVSPFRRAAQLLHSEKSVTTGLDQTIWALKDVSFEVKRGQVIGVIGPNGAGKSTLLKILTRITEPTRGFADIYGRVGSLLEVGTGFHHELTGRENIYLNGAILGMRKAEIDRKFDDIVDFSGVEKFIDTPVKHYSSGMGVRLAFSVAAHLDPEILLVDEVLTVGDFAFQRKCLAAMKDVAAFGRTVVFVSHSMAIIESLCRRVIWIDQGTIVDDGVPAEVISRYVDKVNDSISSREVGEYQNFGHRRGTGEIQFGEFRLKNKSGVEVREFSMGETIRMEVDFHVYKDVDHAIFTFGLVDALSQVFLTNWVGRHCPQILEEGEQGTFSVELPNNLLRARKYYVYLNIIGPNEHNFDTWDGIGTEFVIRHAADLEEMDTWIGQDPSLVTLPLTAKIQKI